MREIYGDLGAGGAKELGGYLGGYLGIDRVLGDESPVIGRLDVLWNNLPQATDYLRISYVASQLRKHLESPDVLV